MKSSEIRKKFLSFFNQNKHTIVSSDSLVPAADPSVLFTSAGMNQFKRQFQGLSVTYTRAASCQKCLRTGDLDNVGKTRGHHTFFEMLGNFSFGDYFKEQAIGLAWEFLTKELLIDENRLWISVHCDDEESFKIWKEKISIPVERIVKMGDQDNFWPSEPTVLGPCGYCSEIYFDLGEQLGCQNCSPACSCSGKRFLEVWNLVFTEFERKESGELKPLPRKNIDTGMGLERLAAVMQGVESNFQTDLFSPIIEEILRLAVNPLNSENNFKVNSIADHIRAVSFAISDGINPSNEERGYVIRSLIRRAFLFGRDLGIEGAFLYKLVSRLSSIMSDQYPELLSQREMIAQVIENEEERFISSLDVRLPEFQNLLKELSQNKIDEVPADILFRYYDTFGLAWELMQQEAEKLKIKTDKTKFLRLLEKQRKRSRDKSKLSGAIFEKIFDFKRQKVSFVDYKKLQAKIITIFSIDNENREITSQAASSSVVEVVLDKTPFYPEGGGQAADTGTIMTSSGGIIQVKDTRRLEDTIIHSGVVTQGTISVGEEVTAQIDLKRRLDITRNHTATHLLQAALRKVLGSQVRQQGSMVGQDYLRFDFTYPKQISKEQLERIEDEVNEYILDNLFLRKEAMALDKAKESGALAFFQERYSDEVTVVSIGEHSKELCGGTHVESTGQIGIFNIIQESSIASGIRRIEACTGRFAARKEKQQRLILEKLSNKLQVPQEKISEHVLSLNDSVKTLSREYSKARLALFKSDLDRYLKKAVKVGDINVISFFISGSDYSLLRQMVDLVKAKAGDAVILAASSIDTRAAVVVGVTESLISRGISAAALAQKFALSIGGSGGGRPELAQAGSSNTQGLSEAIEKAPAILEGELKK